MKKMFIYAMILCLVLALSLTACGGDDDDDDNNGNPDEVGKTVTKTITAAAGGEVATESNSAAVTIPAGALSADTDISIEVIAPDSTAQSNIYNFGPEGTEFAQPVTIGLAFTGTVPDGKKAVLGYFDNNAWQEISGSSLSGGKVTGNTSHFSKYTIIFVAEGVIIETDDKLCKDITFSACGGDVLGTWNIQAYCLPEGFYGTGDNPFATVPGCEQSSFTLSFDWTGTVEFKNDASYTVDASASYTFDLALDDTCLNALTGGTVTPEAYCNTINSDAEFDACSYSGGKCACKMSESDTQQDTGTYKTEGTNLIFDENTTPYPYCIKDNTATVQLADMPDELGETESYMILKK